MNTSLATHASPTNQTSVNATGHAVAMVETQAPEQQAPAGPRIRVLLVEDHILVRRAVRALLEQSARIPVIGEAESTPQALGFLDRNTTDVVVTDIRLKKSSGVELTAAIEKRCPQTKTLVLTAHSDEQYFRASVRAGAEGYLLKEATSDQLLSAICDIHEDQLGVFFRDVG